MTIKNTYLQQEVSKHSGSNILINSSDLEYHFKPCVDSIIQAVGMMSLRIDFNKNITISLYQSSVGETTSSTQKRRTGITKGSCNCMISIDLREFRTLKYTLMVSYLLAELVRVFTNIKDDWLIREIVLTLYPRDLFDPQHNSEFVLGLGRVDS